MLIYARNQTFCSKFSYNIKAIKRAKQFWSQILFVAFLAICQVEKHDPVSKSSINLMYFYHLKVQFLMYFFTLKNLTCIVLNAISVFGQV